MLLRGILGCRCERLFLLLLTVFTTSGCAHDVANRYYLSQRFPPKDVEQVELLTTAPSRPYVVMADFQSRGESPDAIRRKAAEIGADAVIVTQMGGAYDNREEWAGDDRRGSFYSRIIGTAILYSQK